MQDVVPLAERLSPDTVTKLERAAAHRFTSAELLRTQSRRLAAVYFYVEMWLAAAYFRSAGFGPHVTIDRDTRHRRMVQARQLRLASGGFVMNSEPHPLVGWARFLEWQRSAADLATADAQRLKEAVERAAVIYNYWRPELRYKVVEITEGQVSTVRVAAMWFKENQSRLAET